MKTLRNLFAAALATAAIIFTVGCPHPTPATPEEPVAAVTFTPNGGEVNPGSPVTLETVTSDAEIYYAIDPASEITAENVKDMLGSMTQTANISTTVTIEKACTIYAVAVRTSTGTTSEVTKASYTLATVPGTVAFAPAAGTVASGTKVKLSATNATGEESCTIYYSTSTALTKDNYSTAGTAYDAAGDGIEITANTTIYAIAVGTSNNPGNASSAAYTLPVTLMNAAPEADDVVYIYYPTGKNVMLSTASSSKLSSATVELDATLGGFAVQDNMAALTVFKNDIGQYVFVSGGKYLTAGATGNSLTLADTFTYLALWEVAAVSSGSNQFYIHSANAIFGANRQSLEFYSGFTVYNRNTTDIYKFQFYKDPSKSSELNDEAKASLALQANSLATPTFSIASTAEGQTIVPGLVTYLSSASLDVDFYYTTDGSEITRENYATKASADPATAFKYDASQGIAIEGNQGETKTINAIAVKTVQDGEATRGIFSLPASAVYSLGEDTNTYLAKVDTLTDNDVVAIYYPAGKTTISSTTSGTGFSGTAATVSTKGLVLSDSLTQFTVKKLNTDGYVFVNGGKYLSRTESNGLSLADAFTDNSVWNLEAAGTSTDSFYIKNAGDSTRYIEYYESQNNKAFTMYTFQADKAAIYTFQFYKNAAGNVEQITLPLLPVSFSVPGGPVVADTPVALTSKNGEGTEIYWKWEKDGTLDSSNYNSATKYDAAKEPTITEDGTLQAIAVKGGNTSDVTKVTYTINNSPNETVDISKLAEQKTNRLVADGTNVKMTTTTISGNNYSYFTSGLLRWYQSACLTFEAKDSKKIKSIVITGKTWTQSGKTNGMQVDITVGNVTENVGEQTTYNFAADASKGSCAYDSTGLIYTYTALDAGVDVVSLSAGRQIRAESIVVYYAE